MQNNLITRIQTKLKIGKLNTMQNDVLAAEGDYKTVIIESPTGTGKSLAFLLSILPLIDGDKQKLQALILVPTRELAVQIENIIKQCALGLKIHAFYGGYSGQEDQKRLKHTPSILIGTPGRISALVDQGHVELHDLEAIVLDEYDKILELGFEQEMMSILDQLPDAIQRQVLTSATQLEKIPPYIDKGSLKVLRYESKVEKLVKYALLSTSRDKVAYLRKLILNSGDKRMIVFCSYKEDVDKICDRLQSGGIPAVPFHGDMEQKYREESLIQFRNGSSRIMVASDLAARGLDVPNLNLVIHYQLPLSEKSETHRNGRTARMKTDGAAVYIKDENEDIPEFIQDLEFKPIDTIENTPFDKVMAPCDLVTLHLNVGRNEKISKGDVLGFLTKVAGIPGKSVGMIHLSPRSTYVALKKKHAEDIINRHQKVRIKKKQAKLQSLSKI
ncbi:MAG: DEAD/DEAH box helicase [Crocinitomicaceae bacterium]